MRANMVQADDRRLLLTARAAIYDTQREQLRMRDGVQVRTEGGQEVDLNSAMSTSRPARSDPRSPSRCGCRT